MIRNLSENTIMKFLDSKIKDHGMFRFPGPEPGDYSKTISVWVTVPGRFLWFKTESKIEHRVGFIDSCTHERLSIEVLDKKYTDIIASILKEVETELGIKTVLLS